MLPSAVVVAKLWLSHAQAKPKIEPDFVTIQTVTPTVVEPPVVRSALKSFVGINR
jgi:hypothetical protein